MLLKETIRIIIPAGRHLQTWQKKLNDYTLLAGQEIDLHWTIIKTSTYRKCYLPVKCDNCGLEHERRIRDLTESEHFCPSCRKIGDKNPQHGVPTSDKAKDALKSWMKINGNPFTWKSTIEKIKSQKPWLKGIEKRKGQKRSAETKKKMSEGIKKAYETGKLKPRSEWSNIEIKKFKDIEYQGTYELRFLQFVDSIGKLEMIERGPIIKYFFEGESHNYFSDFKIKDTNIVFEVKSDYYWKKKLDVNLAKKKAAESQYDYYLIINNNFRKIENILKNI